MIRKLNRIFQDYMREKRLKLGRFFWDKKKCKEEIKFGNFIENNSIKSILFLRYDGKIGDMVINTLMFREIKKSYPDIKIGVVTRGGNQNIILENPNIDKIYHYEKNRKKILELAKEIREEKYDLLIDFSELLRVNQMMFINKCSARFNMGLDKNEWNLFDISYTYPKGDFHITKLYEKILVILGIKDINLDYDLYFSEKDKEKVNLLLEKNEGKEKFVLNPFAASKHREINRENITKIIDIVLSKGNRVVFLIGEKSKEKEIMEIVGKYQENVIFPDLDTIMETAYLIKQSDWVITPDTSIVHITACFKKPMIAIYRVDGSISNQINKNLWAPNYLLGKQIFSMDNDCKIGEEPSINKFSIEEIEKILN